MNTGYKVCMIAPKYANNLNKQLSRLLFILL